MSLSGGVTVKVCELCLGNETQVEDGHGCRCCWRCCMGGRVRPVGDIGGVIKRPHPL